MEKQYIANVQTIGSGTDVPLQVYPQSNRGVKEGSGRGHLPRNSSILEMLAMVLKVIA